MTAVTSTAHIDGWVGDLTYDPQVWQRMQETWSSRYPTIDSRMHTMMENIARSDSAEIRARIQRRLEHWVDLQLDRGVRVTAAEFRRAQFEHYHRRPVTPLPD